MECQKRAFSKPRFLHSGSSTMCHGEQCCLRYDAPSPPRGALSSAKESSSVAPRTAALRDEALGRPLLPERAGT